VLPPGNNPARPAAGEATQAGPARSPGRETETYVVRPNDSLWRIAKRKYGSAASQRVVNALYEFNKSRLEDPNKLRVGEKLVLPDLEELIRRGILEPVRRFGPGTIRPGRERTQAASRRDASSTAGLQSGRSPGRLADSASGAGRTAPEAQAAGRKWQWYTVRQGDRLARIAKEKLGDPNLWTEIHKLNRDRLSNPHLLRPGIRIRIPVRSSEPDSATQSQL